MSGEVIQGVFVFLEGWLYISVGIMCLVFVGLIVSTWIWDKRGRKHSREALCREYEDYKASCRQKSAKILKGALISMKIFDAETDYQKGWNDALEAAKDFCEAEKFEKKEQTYVNKANQ